MCPMCDLVTGDIAGLPHSSGHSSSDSFPRGRSGARGGGQARYGSHSPSEEDISLLGDDRDSVHG